MLEGRYYYNWTCVDKYSTQLCPDGWRIPSQTDFIDLMSATTAESLKSEWGSAGGVWDFEVNYTYVDYYWTASAMLSDSARAIRFANNGQRLWLDNNVKSTGFMVRCIK